MSISVIIITKNEEHAIHDCLSSISWADEIIVVDSGSTDNTVSICKSYNARVEITDDWPGFGAQKNRALSLATGDWILSIDADERVSKDLQYEIQTIIKTKKNDQAFRMPRKSSFCGQFIKHGGWCPDYVLRLFPNNQNEARFSDDLVHERVVFKGSIGTLINPIIHISYSNLEEVLGKMNTYSSAGAQMAFAKSKKGSLKLALSHSIWTFIRMYVLKFGFLDGRMGFILAVSNSQETYYRYLKLALLHKQ
jgi:glycosyltransferase involved in cell wall biosynthesis